MTDPASENRFGWFLTRVARHSLIWPIHYEDVPLNRVWFITSLSQRVYDFVRVWQQGISCTIDLIC